MLFDHYQFTPSGINIYYMGSMGSALLETVQTALDLYLSALQILYYRSNLGGPDYYHDAYLKLLCFVFIDGKYHE